MWNNRKERYESFTKLDKSEPFKEYFKNRDYEVVQVNTEEQDIGFCGAFQWKNNKVISLDGDSYNENMLVEKFREWNIQRDGVDGKGLDILVGNDW